MYTREYEGQDGWEKELPESYGGQLFGRREEAAKENQDAAPPSEKQGQRLRDVFSRVLEKIPLRGLFTSEMLLTAFAVWLLSNGREDDDYLFLVLLFFLLK